MSTRLKEKLEKIKQILANLSQKAIKGIPIIVEGRKDVEALRALGVKGAILTVKTGGKSFLEAMNEIEKTGVSEVILLLDFDRRGKQGTLLLKEDLERLKIKPDLDFWRALSALTGRDLQCIEGLRSYVDTLESKSA